MLDIGIEMRKKPIVLALILVIVSAGVGTGFSLAAGTIQTDNRVAYLEDVEFTDDFIDLARLWRITGGRIRYE